MKIIKVTPRGFGSNSYILTANGKTAVVIDPAEPHIADVLSDNGLECSCVLLTHGHFDHVGGCGVLFKNGAHIYCNEREKELIFSKEYLGLFGGVQVPDFKIARTFSDGEEFEECKIKFKVFTTAGHTAGSSCIIAANALFTGDTLFAGGVGRWDLPTGNFAELSESLNRLVALDGEYDIYCGHGANSTLTHEKQTNPYLRNI